MKITKIPTFILLLTSCTPTSIISPQKSSEISNEIIEHDYSEISYRKIGWDDIFFQDKNEYKIYFYSLTCAHCKNLKNSVIEYALKNDDLFFIEANEKVVIKNDVSDTIGATSISQMGILGYPSLIKIDQKVCVFNVAGESEIISKLNL